MEPTMNNLQATDAGEKECDDVQADDDTFCKYANVPPQCVASRSGVIGINPPSPADVGLEVPPPPPTLDDDVSHWRDSRYSNHNSSTRSAPGDDPSRCEHSVHQRHSDTPVMWRVPRMPYSHRSSAVPSQRHHLGTHHTAAYSLCSTVTSTSSPKRSASCGMPRCRDAPAGETSTCGAFPEHDLYPDVGIEDEWMAERSGSWLAMRCSLAPNQSLPSIRSHEVSFTMAEPPAPVVPGHRPVVSAPTTCYTTPVTGVPPTCGAFKEETAGPGGAYLRHVEAVGSPLRSGLSTDDTCPPILNILSATEAEEMITTRETSLMGDAPCVDDAEMPVHLHSTRPFLFHTAESSSAVDDAQAEGGPEPISLSSPAGTAVAKQDATTSPKDIASPEANFPPVPSDTSRPLRTWSSGGAPGAASCPVPSAMRPSPSRVARATSVVELPHNHQLGTQRTSLSSTVNDASVSLFTHSHVTNLSSLLEDVRGLSALMTRQRAALVAELENRKAHLRRHLAQLQQEATSHNIFALIRASNASQVQYLLQEGLCSVDERDYNGCTPLHVAASEGNRAIVCVLLTFGADALAVDAAGRTPVDCAAANRHSGVDRYLLAVIQHRKQLSSKCASTPKWVARDRGIIPLLAAVDDGDRREAQGGVGEDRRLPPTRGEDVGRRITTPSANVNDVVSDRVPRPTSPPLVHPCSKYGAGCKVCGEGESTATSYDGTSLFPLMARRPLGSAHEMHSEPPSSERTVTAQTSGVHVPPLASQISSFTSERSMLAVVTPSYLQRGATSTGAGEFRSPSSLPHPATMRLEDRRSSPLCFATRPLSNSAPASMEYRGGSSTAAALHTAMFLNPARFGPPRSSTNHSSDTFSHLDVSAQTIEDYRHEAVTGGRAVSLYPTCLHCNSPHPRTSPCLPTASEIHAAAAAAEASSGEGGGATSNATPDHSAAKTGCEDLPLPSASMNTASMLDTEAAGVGAGFVNLHSSCDSIGLAAEDEDLFEDPEPFALDHLHSSSYTTISDTVSLIVCMVGLPGRGKSFISRRIARYFNWKGIPCRVFNAGNYRRQLLGVEGTSCAEFFDPSNVRAKELREHMAELACQDLISFLLEHPLAVGILDATNTTRARRQRLRTYFDRAAKECKLPYRLLFIESVCTGESIITENILRSKCTNEDFRHMADSSSVIAEFCRRIQQYEKVYETLDPAEDLPFIKIINVKRHFIVHKAHSGLGSRIAFFLLNLHPVAYPIYIALPGETEGDKEQILGGDERLTPAGEEYACALRHFIQDRYVPHMVVLHATNRSVLNTLRPLMEGDMEEFGIKSPAARKGFAQAHPSVPGRVGMRGSSPVGVEGRRPSLINSEDGDEDDLTDDEDDENEEGTEEVLCPVPGLDSINYGRFSGHSAVRVKELYPRLSSLLYNTATVTTGRDKTASNASTCFPGEDATAPKADVAVPPPDLSHDSEYRDPTDLPLPPDTAAVLPSQPIYFQHAKEALQCLWHAPTRADPRLSYCVQFPNGESCRQVNVRLEPALMAVMRCQSPVFVVASSVPAQGMLAFFADLMPELSPTLRLPKHCVVEIGVKDDITIHPLIAGAWRRPMESCDVPPGAQEP